MRDANEQLRIAATVSNWLMAFHRWQVGDGVARILGRGIWFGVSTTSYSRQPTIHSVELRLMPESRQSVIFNLADDSLQRGV